MTTRTLLNYKALCKWIRLERKIYISQNSFSFHKKTLKQHRPRSTGYVYDSCLAVLHSGPLWFSFSMDHDFCSLSFSLWPTSFLLFPACILLLKWATNRKDLLLRSQVSSFSLLGPNLNMVNTFTYIVMCELDSTQQKFDVWIVVNMVTCVKRLTRKPHMSIVIQWEIDDI